MIPKLDYTSVMLQGYADYMSQKDQSEREAYGPRPERSTSADRHVMNFRVEPMLFKKLQALAEIENGVNRAEKGAKAAHISTNAELHYILETAVKEYEKKHGSIPGPEDDAGIQRHVRARTK